MKKLLTIVFILAIASTVFASAGENKKDIIGEWKYKVPTAPYGYQKGSLIINEKEGKLVGEVKFEDGYKVELKNLTYEEGTFKCGLYIDYDYISVDTKVTGNEMKGNVNTPEGKMNMTAEKSK
jgi:hypothetical protein